MLDHETAMSSKQVIENSIVLGIGWRGNYRRRKHFDLAL
jgi:hypothetical protein